MNKGNHYNRFDKLFTLGAQTRDDDGLITVCKTYQFSRINFPSKKLFTQHFTMPPKSFVHLYSAFFKHVIIDNHHELILIYF
jgi:ABC-type maltose transport system permease subunit